MHIIFREEKAGKRTPGSEAAQLRMQLGMHLDEKDSIIDFMAIGRFLRRNLVSIVFPTLTAVTIYLDWSHTQKWKKQNKN